MNVDFNNVRVQAINDYNRVVKQLNYISNISENYSLVTAMDDLRNALVIIAATYVPDNPDFIDVMDGRELLSIYSEDDEAIE